MSLSNHIATTRLRDRAMGCGMDTDLLELALFALGEIQDGDYGLASDLAHDALDECERRVVEGEGKRASLGVVGDA